MATAHALAHACTTCVDCGENFEIVRPSRMMPPSMRAQCVWPCICVSTCPSTGIVAPHAQRVLVLAVFTGGREPRRNFSSRGPSGGGHVIGLCASPFRHHRLEFCRHLLCLRSFRHRPRNPACVSGGGGQHFVSPRKVGRGPPDSHFSDRSRPHMRTRRSALLCLDESDAQKQRDQRTGSKDVAGARSKKGVELAAEAAAEEPPTRRTEARGRVRGH